MEIEFYSFDGRMLDMPRPDGICDASNYTPDDPKDFAVVLRVEVYDPEHIGSEPFMLICCSPLALLNRRLDDCDLFLDKNRNIFLGHQILIMYEWDRQALDEVLEKWFSEAWELDSFQMMVKRSWMAVSEYLTNAEMLDSLSDKAIMEYFDKNRGGSTLDKLDAQL